jgi:LPS export ABC transporter protein LptC
MRAGKVLLWTAATVLCCGAAACPTSKAAAPKRATQAAIPDSADQIVFGARLVITDQGVNNGVLLADTALSYDDGQRYELKRVNLTFYTKQGVKDGVMTSRAGTYNMRLQRIEARGDVVVLRDDGKRFMSPQLVFDQVRNQFFSDSSFVLNEPARTVNGIGFESDPKLNNVKCLRACKLVAPVKVPTR